MVWALVYVLFQVHVQAQEVLDTQVPSPNQVIPSEELDGCQEDLKNLADDMRGLEFFLQDKKNYKKFCPNTKWEQPKLEEYKKEPKSYLPDTCKVVKDSGI
tara:strand:+ start:6709 stop:7011 length:303 start_codon:yes stop_codon:yes gene_type:complete